MKQRQEKLFECIACNNQFYTRANRVLRCKPCSLDHKYPQHREDIDWRLGRILANARNRAKTKNHSFDIDLDYLKLMWENQKGICVITNRPFDLSDYVGVGKINPNTVSIDRIVPEKGYTKGNIRLVTFHANMAISEFGLDNLIQLSKDVLKTVESSSNKENNG